MPLLFERTNEKSSATASQFWHSMIMGTSRTNSSWFFCNTLSLHCLFRGFGFICENRSKQAIRLTSDFQGSTNVVSLRKTFRMVDTIPPKTKQLFAIFARKTTSADVQIGNRRFLSFTFPSYSFPLSFSLPSWISGECSLLCTDVKKMIPLNDNRQWTMHARETLHPSLLKRTVRRVFSRCIS